MAFLKAEWRYLAMLNYAVDPALLRDRVPRGTELDTFNGNTFVSLVGFRFLNTRVRRVAIPFHCNFDEVNLRFYVRRIDAGTVKRGVVFIREIVPRYAIAAVARWLYNEQYVDLPMGHEIDTSNGVSVEYRWRLQSHWNRLKLRTSGDPSPLVEGSEEQFISEHYWGYTAQRDGGCLEYEVAHPPWNVWRAEQATFQGDCTALYGPDLARVLQRKPDTAFLADGSPVAVNAGIRLHLPSSAADSISTT
jgi:uncharacterized protein YqjF (DUF2071 family)